MDKPLVSIIIPTYKRKDKLLEAINSAIIQTYSNIEIIVVDDNDPGVFSDYIKEVIAGIDDVRVKLISYGANHNGAYARNQGIFASKGKYVAFLDDDDLFYESKIEKQVEFMKLDKLGYSGVYCKMSNNKNLDYPYQSGDLSLFILKQISLTPTPTLMIKRDALIDIGGFDINLKRHQDYDLILRFFKKYTIGFLNEFLVTQGPNDGENILYGKSLEQTKLYFLEKFEKDIRSFSEEEQMQIYFINYFNVFLRSVKTKDIKIAIKYFLLSVSLSPVLFVKQLFKFLKSKFLHK